MTAKLLFLFGFSYASAASWNRAKCYSRSAAGQPASRMPAAAAKRIPQPRHRLECRWQRDPATGALRAQWVCLAADSAASASGRDIAGGRDALRPAA